MAARHPGIVRLMSDQPRTPGDQQPSALSVAKDLGHVSILAALSATLPALGGFLALGVVIARAGAWRPKLAEMGAPAALAYALAFGVATGFALMPTYALSFIAGHLFGMGRGGGAALAGVGLGAIIGYTWASLLARQKVMGKIGSNPRHAAVRRAIVDRGAAGATGFVALLRFPPNSPFAVTNLVMGATGVRFGPFLLGTLLGMAPRTLFVAYLGAAAAELSKESMVGAGAAYKWVFIGVSLAVFAFALWLANRWAQKALAGVGSAGSAGGSGGAPTGTKADDPALG